MRAMLLAAATLLWLPGCATVPADEGMEAPTAPPEGPPARTAPSQAVLALAAKADEQARAGAFDAAAASLERALRLEPRSPGLWTRLANVRLEQRRWDQAEALALRSNSLAAGDRFVQSVNWRLIAEARRRGGDVEGARRAEERAAALDVDGR